MSVGYIRGNLIQATEYDAALVGTLVAEPQVKKDWIRDNFETFGVGVDFAALRGVTDIPVGDNLFVVGQVYAGTSFDANNNGRLQFCRQGNACTAQNIIYGVPEEDLDEIRSALPGVDIIAVPNIGGEFPTYSPFGLEYSYIYGWDIEDFSQSVHISGICGKIINYSIYSGPSNYSEGVVESVLESDVARSSPPVYENDLIYVVCHLGADSTGDDDEETLGIFFSYASQSSGRFRAVRANGVDVQFCRDFFGLDG